MLSERSAVTSPVVDIGDVDFVDVEDSEIVIGHNVGGGERGLPTEEDFRALIEDAFSGVVAALSTPPE